LFGISDFEFRIYIAKFNKINKIYQGVEEGRRYRNGNRKKDNKDDMEI